ncbi:MAG: response regulator [Chitinophagales bacterium]
MERNAPDLRNLHVKKILLAEDVELNQYLAKHMLEAKGLEVTIANNGFEALDLLSRIQFDCVLMDIQMPEMDGIETAIQIRKMDDPAKASIPIIALTANVLEEDIEKYKEAGMNDFLAKPFDETGLFTVIYKNQQYLTAQADQQLTKSNEQISPMHSIKLYDLSMVQSVSGGDNGFIKKMIHLFIETVPQNVQELSNALLAENWEQLGKMAHKLKSTVDSMGIKSIYSDIRTVESNAKEKKNLHDIPAQIRKIETVIVNCIEQLKEEMNRA